MSETFRSHDADQYRMSFREPHRVLEPVEREIEVVGEALQMLVDLGILSHSEYDEERFLAHRRAVRELFEIPWTAITPRMQRFLYAVNAILQPSTMVAAGIFCGNTYISNAGAAVGPGACYRADRLIGVEIKPEEAERARRNVRRLSDDPAIQIIADDAVTVVKNLAGTIDLLYLDADGAGGRGKSVYLDILEAAYDKMPTDAVILAHNSVNSAAALRDYLDFVRDSRHCRQSVNIIFDDQGLEVSQK